MSATHDSNPAASEPIILEHESDGIQEYDNPMPAWWSSIFWWSIGFSALYALYYMIGIGPGAQAEYKSDLGAFYEEQFAKLGDLKPTQETILALTVDPKMMQAASGLFTSNCAVCHARDGGGGTGPNLTDNSYLNIKTIDDIFPVVSNGVVAKGMPAWNKRFGEAQLVLLSAYVAHLRGTSPATPKAPQGEEIAPWPKAPVVPPTAGTATK